MFGIGVSTHPKLTYAVPDTTPPCGRRIDGAERPDRVRIVAGDRLRPEQHVVALEIVGVGEQLERAVPLAREHVGQQQVAPAGLVVEWLRSRRVDVRARAIHLYRVADEYLPVRS